MTRKQEIFIKEYVLTRNGAESARKAGYNGPNCHKIAHKLLKQVDISRQIEAEFARIIEQYKFKEEDVYKKAGDLYNDTKTDTSNKVRLIELMAKVLGMTKDATVNVSLYQQLGSDKLAKARKALKERKLRKPSQT